MGPDFALGHYMLGQFYLSRSESENAIAEFNKTLEIIPGFATAIASLGHAYALMGRQVEARQLVQELLDKSATSYVPPALIAEVEFALGDKEKAYEHLERAFEERSNWLLYFKAFPGFDDIRAEEKFAKLIKRMGLDD